MNNRYRIVAVLILSFVLLITVVTGTVYKKRLAENIVQEEFVLNEPSEFEYKEKESIEYIEEELVFTDEVNRYLDSMSTREKLSLLFVVDYDSLNSENSEMTGGVIYTQNSIYYQTVTNGELKPLRFIEQSETEFIPVNGIYNPLLTENRTVNEFGKTDSQDELIKYLDNKIADMKYYGFNAFMGPYSNPDDSLSSFGKDAINTADMLKTTVNEFNRNGIFTVSYSFPYQLEKNVSYDELLMSDMMTFQVVIDAGVKGIVITNYPCQAINGNRTPCSMNENTIDVLRASMGFEGLCIAVADELSEYSESEAVAEMFKAGIDMFYKVDNYSECIDYLCEMMEDGELSLIHLDNAAGKVIQNILNNQ